MPQNLHLPPIPAQHPVVGTADRADPIWIRWLTALADRVQIGNVIDAASVVSGVFSKARLPADVAYTDVAQQWTQPQSMGQLPIRDVADPTQPYDAVTKNYVDQAVINSGLLFAVRGEIPSGTIDGSNTVFSTVGNYGTTLEVFLNGLRQVKGVDYTETTATQFTLLTAPTVGDRIVVNYADRGSGGVPGMALLQVATLASATTVDLTAWESSAYDAYVILIVGATHTGSDGLRLLFSVDGGATWKTTAQYNYNWGTLPGFSQMTGSVADAFNLGPTTTLGSNGSWTARLDLSLAAGTNPMLEGRVTCHNSGNSNLQSFGGGYGNFATRVNALRVTLQGGGTFTGGRVQIYGMTQS